MAKNRNTSARSPRGNSRVDLSESPGSDALRLSEARFRDLVEGSIQGIIVHRHFKPLFANQAAADIFGVNKPSDILAMDSILEFYAPQERVRITAYKDARMRGEVAPSSYEYQGKRVDGTSIRLENRVTVVEWDGEPANLTTIFDITEREQAQQALGESEERFRNLVEGSIQGILVSRNFGMLFANRAMADVFGFDDQAELLAQKSMIPFIAPEDRARIEGYTAARLRGNPAPTIYEFRGIRKDGSQIWLEIRVSLVSWIGAPASLSTVIDITDRKRAEELLQESEERFRDFAESATDWFWEMDAELRFTYFSRRFEEATGVSPDTLLRRTRRELIEAGHTIFGSEDGRAQWERHLQQIEAHKPFRDFRPPSGLSRGPANYFSISGKPIFDDADIFKGYRGTGANVTEQVKAELSLRQRETELRLHRDRAEEANRAKSEFLANVSHELRTPLNAILGFSDIMKQQLLGNADPEKYIGYASNIHDSATNLLRLITDILDISTVEAGKYDLQVEEIDFLGLAEACCRSVQDRANLGKIDLIVDIESDVPPLRADRRAVQNMLLHLLENAIAFTPQDGKVSFRAAADDDWFRIVVEDTGSGIPQEEMPKLTDPFEQGQRDPYRREERTGLGLAVTLSMVKLHNGKMNMESEVGQGTRVTIMLPRDAV